MRCGRKVAGVLTFARQQRAVLAADRVLAAFEWVALDQFLVIGPAGDPLADFAHLVRRGRRAMPAIGDQQSRGRRGDQQQTQGETLDGVQHNEGSG